MRNSSLAALVALLAWQGASALTLEEITGSLGADRALEGTARFMVTMPQLPDDVVYTLDFATRPAPADALAPCSYLIEWRSESEGAGGEGFTAYFDGHHYRYNGNQRIQEYHMEWDSIPFMPAASARGLNKGVQRTARFVDILPAFLAENLKAAAADPGSTVTLHADTLVGGQRSVVVDVLTTVGGAVARESEYLLDAATLLPRRVIHENNPGSISEQTVSVSYEFASEPSAEALTEQTLVDRYPEEFATFRHSNFRIENLRGKPLPGFALPTLTGERYSRQAGDRFRTPTIVALMESGQTLNPQTVKALREAADMLSYPADIIYVFADSHADTIEETVGPIREGEHLLMSGRGLVRDCGAAMLPSLLLCCSDGTVADVIIGYNNDLASDVIQKMILIK